MQGLFQRAKRLFSTSTIPYSPPSRLIRIEVGKVVGGVQWLGGSLFLAMTSLLQCYTAKIPKPAHQFTKFL